MHPKLTNDSENNLQDAFWLVNLENGRNSEMRVDDGQRMTHSSPTRTSQAVPTPRASSCVSAPVLGLFLCQFENQQRVVLSVAAARQHKWLLISDSIPKIIIIIIHSVLVEANKEGICHSLE
jgi:hypothetical protein